MSWSGHGMTAKRMAIIWERCRARPYLAHTASRRTGQTGAAAQRDTLSGLPELRRASELTGVQVRQIRCRACTAEKSIAVLKPSSSLTRVLRGAAETPVGFYPSPLGSLLRYRVR